MTATLSLPPVGAPSVGAEAVLTAMRDAVVFFDGDGLVQHLNPAARLLFGSRAVELEQAPFEHLFAASCRAPARANVLAFVRNGPPFVGPSRLEVELGGGARTALEVTPVRFPDDEGWAGALLLRDDSEHEAFTRLLEHEATHDGLTGLPNRGRLRVAATEALDGALSFGRTLAVLHLGLDGFAAVNERHGHDVGDAVLVEAARRLRRLAPAGAVFRVGGDEFVVLLEGEGGLFTLWSETEALKRGLDEAYRVEGRYLRLSAGIGVAFSERGCTATSLLRRADSALSRAKEQGPGRIEAFDLGAAASVGARLALDEAVRKPDLLEELSLRYQPVVEPGSARVVGFEALLRWETADCLTSSPASLVAALERTGRIVEVGAWVLETACQQTVDWQVESGQCDLHIAVNVSVCQLERPDFVQTVRAVLARTGLAAGCLSLEITETVVSLDLPMMVRRLGELRALGVVVAIDDFGTGYSSFAYLHRLPADVLKIDRAFVSRLGEEGSDAAIVQAITALAQTLGMRIVAEGVETAAQHEILCALGVDLLQGFWFGRPEVQEEASARLYPPRR